MGKLTRMIAGVASVAAAAALIAGTVTTASAAPNEPPKGVTPAAYDVVGVGSNTTEYVMDAISVGYNKTVKTHNVAHPYFYSYDALPLGVNVPGKYTIKPKAGCATIARPDGSGAGITALDSSQVIKYKGADYACVDFGRSSGGRKPTYPADKPGGIVFVAFAKDAITWAARSAAKGGTDAPASLNTAQLKAIFTCKDTNWSQVGGKAGAIKVYLPQARELSPRGRSSWASRPSARASARRPRRTRALTPASTARTRSSSGRSVPMWRRSTTPRSAARRRPRRRTSSAAT